MLDVVRESARRAIIKPPAGDAGSVLKFYYQNRLAAAAAEFEAGRGVIGTFGAGVPTEIAMATGHLPISIAPLPNRPTPHAEEFVTSTFDRLQRPIFDQIISGEIYFMDLVVIVSPAERDALVYNSCKEVLRWGEGRNKMPPLFLLALMGHRHAASREYGLGQFTLLSQRLRAISAIAPTADRLRSATETVNGVRAAVRKLLKKRRDGALSGVDALTAIGAGKFMAPADYARNLEGYVAGLKADGALSTRPRLLVLSSTPLITADLYTALESAGGVVVAEDDWWGSRCIGPDIDPATASIETIFDHYHIHTPNRAIYPLEARFEWLFEEAVKPDIDGIVVYMPPSDRKLGWDYPSLRDFAAAKGKPLIMFREDVLEPDGRAQIIERTKDFVGGLKGKKQ
jgi:benzoyl-CoA reductase/2-hydroxyglutaryl-CoA dehydratase subunit BcrC/BadD/HgdB